MGLSRAAPTESASTKRVTGELKKGVTDTESIKEAPRAGTNPMSVKITHSPAVEVVDMQALVASFGAAVALPWPSAKVANLHRQLG
jgi:hypothetical protein